MATRKAAAKDLADTATESVRKLDAVVPQIQQLRSEGKTVPEICEELMVSYHVVNQIITQSYKMSMDTVGVFERQEKMRLGIE